MPGATERDKIVYEFFAVGTTDGHLYGFLSRVADGFVIYAALVELALNDRLASLSVAQR